LNIVSRFLILSLLLASLFITNAHSVTTYAPQPNDFFNYSETITVNNGQGSYSGYTDQTKITGMERMNSVSGSAVSTHYSWSSSFSNSLGSSSTNSSSGDYTWSSSSFTYINGTDSQYGYSKPIYVWFAMNPSLPVGGTFEVLNTPFTVLSKSYSFQVPGGTRYILTIQTQGTGSFARNDVYGRFTASYTWTEYFDPTTGYIVGYNYVEQDTGCWTDPSNPSAGCQSASFTWTDNLGVTSTSYTLTPGTAPNLGLLGFGPDFDYAVAAVVALLILGLAFYARRRARRMDTIPEHPPTPGIPPGAPSTAPWESKIDLGSKPPEQVVLRDVAMRNCKFCGILIPTTAEKCPYCGGPNQ
jgi:hypothetical protein